MYIDEIRTIGVIGAGTMGSQIAQQCALYGYEVCLIDTDPAQLERAVQSNRGHLQRRVDKGRLTAEEMQTALSLVEVSDDLESAKGVDFVIEAVVEQVDIKREVFGDLEAEGRTGHPLAWENVRAAILTDLHELLERDQTWRDAEGLVPRRF